MKWPEKRYLHFKGRVIYHPLKKSSVSFQSYNKATLCFAISAIHFLYGEKGDTSLVPCSNRKETIFGKLSCNRGWVSILEKPCHLSIVGLSRHSLPRNVHRNLFLIGFLCLFSLCSYIIELIQFYSTKRTRESHEKRCWRLRWGHEPVRSPEAKHAKTAAAEQLAEMLGLWGPKSWAKKRQGYEIPKVPSMVNYL